MVNITSVLGSGSLFFIADFNGNRLDLAQGNPSDLNPIISFPPDAPDIDINQKWQLIPMGGTNLQIKNAVQRGPFLSYSGVSTAASFGYSAATASNSVPLNFTITQVSDSDNTFVLQEIKSGEVLTAITPPVMGYNGTPVIFTPVIGGVPQTPQIWTLEETS